MLGIPRAEVKARVQEALAMVDLAGFDDRYVDQISGGQQQRVALARALILAESAAVRRAVEQPRRQPAPQHARKDPRAAKAV